MSEHNKKNETTCPKCNGTKKVKGRTCPLCNGFGTVYAP